MYVNQFLNPLEGAGRTVSCALSSRCLAQCRCAPCLRDTTDVLIQQSSFSPFFTETNSLIATAGKHPLLHEWYYLFRDFFVVFCFSLASNHINDSHWLTSHFHSCYLASTISSWSSPVQMDQYHSFVHTLKITHWITVIKWWLSQLGTAV